MSATDPSVITLRALSGKPLAEPAIERMIVATAHAIAERQGVAVLGLDTAPDRITVELQCNRVAAVGFAAELRRLTTAWYTGKYGAVTLWGEPSPDDQEDWKTA